MIVAYVFIVGQSRKSVELIFWDCPFYMTIECTQLHSVLDARFLVSGVNRASAVIEIGN